ncbi:MAG: hypothetical protein JWM83_2800 [Candidatus Angelobacter sp.]|nr:hypothetical protein [Candidatus Angelobacter sp.]
MLFRRAWLPLRREQVERMGEVNECYAYFHVAGQFNPSDLTRRLGVEPTRISVKGEVIPRTKMLRKFSRWELHSRLARTESFELHIADVLDQLDAKKAAFRELSIELGGQMELVGYFRVDYPGLVFERMIVERMAHYALSIDFDFYFYAPAEQPPTPVDSD